MLKTDAITHTFRKPIHPPSWWEGHHIAFKQYPFGTPGPGYCTVNLCSRDASKQQFSPWKIGQFVTVSVGGKRMRGQVSDVDIYRPGWSDSHHEASSFDPDEDPGEWKITLTFPKIPTPIPS